MPYLNVKVSIPESAESASRIAAILMKHTVDILRKKAEVTSIVVDFIEPAYWFIGGEPTRDSALTTFYLDIRITDGTNTKSDKGNFVRTVFADLAALIGPINPASYIVIHDVRADSWGYQGSTQEYRYIHSLSL